MKGITPIIAVILLLLMTVAAGAATMFWFSKLQSAIQTQTEAQVSQMVGQMAAQFKLLGGYADITNNNIVNISLSNTGTAALLKNKFASINIIAYYVNGSTDRCFKGGFTDCTFVSLAPGNVGYCWINISDCGFSTDPTQYSNIVVTVTYANGFSDSVAIYDIS